MARECHLGHQDQIADLSDAAKAILPFWAQSVSKTSASNFKCIS